MGKLTKVILIVVILIVLLSSMLVSGLAVTGCSGSVQGTQVGNQAPDFHLLNLDGQSISLSDLRGKAVLVNFWASWCSPCRAEMPFIQRLHESWSDNELVILAVNAGEEPSTVKEFVDSFGLSFMILLDTKGEVALDYNVRGIPVTFFIDKDGMIRDIKFGTFSSKAEIERRLSKIIP